MNIFDDGLHNFLAALLGRGKSSAATSEKAQIQECHKSPNTSVIAFPSITLNTQGNTKKGKLHTGQGLEELKRLNPWLTNWVKPTY